jgi:hypothetical protein
VLAVVVIEKAVIYTARLHEVQKYCSLTNHMWDGFWCLANRRAFERLPPDAQEVVARELDRRQRAELLTAGTAALFLLLLLPPAGAYAQDEGDIETPALGWSNIVRAAALPAGCLMMLLSCATRMLRRKVTDILPVVATLLGVALAAHPCRRLAAKPIVDAEMGPRTSAPNREATR